MLLVAKGISTSGLGVWLTKTKGQPLAFGGGLCDFAASAASEVSEEVDG